MVSSALLWSLLAVSLSGILAQNAGLLPLQREVKGPWTFKLMVIDNQPDSNKQMYKAYTPPGGVLFGAMTRLAGYPHSKFTFTFSENVDYGLYLESVNGLFGNEKDHTYWELLVQKADKTIIRPNVGVSCYIPQANEIVILNYSKW